MKIKLIDNNDNEYIYDLQLNIKNGLCEKPDALTVPEELNNRVFSYMILTGAKEFTFPEFTSESTCCVVSYSYTVNSRIGWSVIKEWDSQNRSFTFEYNDKEPLYSDLDS